MGGEGGWKRELWGSRGLWVGCGSGEENCGEVGVGGGEWWGV